MTLVISSRLLSRGDWLASYIREAMAMAKAVQIGWKRDFLWVYALGN
jgi:hypothetical protein